MVYTFLSLFKYLLPSLGMLCPYLVHVSGEGCGERTPVVASPCTIVLTRRTIPQLHVNMSSVTVLSVILSALPLCLPSPEEIMQRLLALILKLQDKDQVYYWLTSGDRTQCTK